MKHRVQIARIKDMLQLLSLLNHNVSFSLIDTQHTKLLWNLKATTSMISRICDIKDIPRKSTDLHNVSLEYGGYRIEGVVLLSCLTDGESKPLMNEMFVNKMPLPSNNEFSQLMLSIVVDTTQNVAFVNRHGEIRCICIWFRFLFYVF
jgi:hypothetical protein